MTFIQAPSKNLQKLAATGSLPKPVHCYDTSSINAINAAIAAQRPLLIRGEPGVGKSQLARAAAATLGWAFISYVVDARTESTDLLWRFDALERLAEAQVQGVISKNKADLREAMAIPNFISPGPLWWAFNWSSAETQAALRKQQPPVQPDQGDPKKGCIVLLDEIDKADSDVTNGLLEALGLSCFTPLGYEKPVHVETLVPLVIITTNEERILPDAFLRRCLGLTLTLPKVEQEREAFINYLVCRGQAHFQGKALAKSWFHEAAELLATDRQQAIAQQLTPLPGMAEYLDLLRVMHRFPNHDNLARKMQEIADYTVRKHPDLRASTQ